MRGAPPPPPSGTLTLLLIGVLCLIWGSTWLVIKGGLTDLPPFTSASARFGLAAAIMFVITPALSVREGGSPPPAWLWVSLGLCNFAASYGIVYMAETVLPSGLVSILWAAFPLMLAGGGHLFLPGERLRSRQAAGFVVGFLGIVVLFATDVRDVGASAVSMAAILLLSPLVSTVGTILVKRHGRDVSSVLLNRNAMAVGAGVLGAVALTFERDASVTWSPAALASVAYLAIVGTVVTFSLYFWLLRFARANRLALIAFVTPCVAVLLGWSLGGEPVGPSMLLGAGLVLAGVALVVVRGADAGGLAVRPTRLSRRSRSPRSRRRGPGA